jgi:hypothetical protein
VLDGRPTGDHPVLVGHGELDHDGHPHHDHHAHTDGDPDPFSHRPDAQ